MREYGQRELDERIKQETKRRKQGIKNAITWLTRAKIALRQRDCKGATTLLRQALMEIGCE